MDASTEVKTAVSVSREEEALGRSRELFRAKDPVTVVIFGASGDLGKRKLIPALYYLQDTGYLPDRYAVVGFSRTAMSDEAYRESMLSALQEQVKDGVSVVKAENPLEPWYPCIFLATHWILKNSPLFATDLTYALSKIVPRP
jgi:hypothetical protein